MIFEHVETYSMCSPLSGAASQGAYLVFYGYLGVERKSGTDHLRLLRYGGDTHGVMPCVCPDDALERINPSGRDGSWTNTDKYIFFNHICSILNHQICTIPYLRTGMMSLHEKIIQYDGKWQTQAKSRGKLIHNLCIG